MNQPTKKRILIVDDHPLVCERLTEIINATPDLEACGTAASRKEALAAVAKVKPDLVIVDLSLRESHGLDLIKDLHALDRTVAMLVLSMHAESMYGESCLRAGARGYMNKQQATRDILPAIHEVLAGQYSCSPALRDRVMALALGRGKPVTDPLAQLSDRELQVLERIRQGRSAEEIAAELKINRKTVERYRRQAAEKMGLATPADLAREATRQAAMQAVAGLGATS